MSTNPQIDINYEKKSYYLHSDISASYLDSIYGFYGFTKITNSTFIQPTFQKLIQYRQRYLYE